MSLARHAAARRPRWWTQALVVVAVAWSYDEVRSLHGNVSAQGLRDGRWVLHLDRVLHLSWAGPVNGWLQGHTSVAAWLSTYYVVMHLGMTSLTLLALFVCRGGVRYRYHRNVLLALSLVALAVFWFFPTAPPRMLPGFYDAVRAHIPVAYSLEQSAANQYAAVPSLHMAWAVWCAVALASVVPSPWRRLLVLHPLLTAVTVLATGNHYMFDLVSGVALTLGTYAAARAVVRRRAEGVVNEPGFRPTHALELTVWTSPAGHLIGPPRLGNRPLSRWRRSRRRSTNADWGVAHEASGTPRLVRLRHRGVVRDRAHRNCAG